MVTRLASQLTAIMTRRMSSAATALFALACIRGSCLALGSPSPSLLRDGTALYPRAVRRDDGVVVASAVTFDAAGNGIGAIFASKDNGGTFMALANISDAAAADGLCCATLYSLPQTVGSLAAGTLLWAASFGQAAKPAPQMSLRVWASADGGVTWKFLSTIVSTTTAKGLWEPEFAVSVDGVLLCFFSDETQAQHSQVLAVVQSVDGQSWTNRHNVVASSLPALRPGMANVRRIDTGGAAPSYMMTYEVCGVGGAQECAVHVRWSSNVTAWGDATDMGLLLTANGSYFAHTPVLAVVPQSVADAASAPGVVRVVVTAQMLFDAGGLSPRSGDALWLGPASPGASWTAVTAPVAAPASVSSYCPNYSPALLVLPGAADVLEITTQFTGNGVCEAYFAVGQLV